MCSPFPHAVTAAAQHYHEQRAMHEAMRNAEARFFAPEPPAPKPAPLPLPWGAIALPLLPIGIWAIDYLTHPPGGFHSGGFF
jgi:hypothetical protein